MKARLLGLCSLLLLCAGGRAADAPANPPPDQAATEALQSIERLIERGEVGWWKSEADPSIQFLNKYSGLGGDAVAALSLNQAEQLWPAWKTVGNGLERFGIACSVYNCLKSANEGNYNAAVLNALKDFVKYRLSKMGDAMASSAAGVGLIDFALNSFGEAAIQQISDDYWYFYCRYQAQRHPGLAAYIRLIKEGDGTQRGFDAVVASLDSFWEDPETHGIRGFSTLKTQDPDYQATFRSRYLKENLLPFLRDWAERERDREEVAAYVALQRLTEQLRNTTIAVDFALLEKGLNEPPAGAKVDVVVVFYGQQTETRILAQAPIAARNRLSFRLADALSPEGKLPPTLRIRLHRAGATAEPSSIGTTVFDVALNNPSGPWRREAKAGQLAYAAKHPLLTSEWSECSVTLTGAGADQIHTVRFMRLPVGTATNLRELAGTPGGNSVDMRGGQGKTRLSHGRYLVVCDVNHFVFTHGPVKITGPTALTIPVQAAADQTPVAPDLADYRAAIGRAADVVQQRQPARRDALATAGDALEQYWLSAYKALNGYLSTTRALQQKVHAEMAQPNLTPDQQRAIGAKYYPRIAEMEKAKQELERAIAEATRDEETQSVAIEQEARQRHDAVRREFSAVSDEMRAAIGDVQQRLYPVHREFEKLANRVVTGSLLSLPTASLDAELAGLRDSLKQIETGLPPLIQAGERLPALLERYNQVVATIHEIAANEDEIIYFNPANHDGEIATLQSQIEAIRTSGYLEEARTLLQRAERIVEKRRERARRAVVARQELEALARELPLPDAALWSTQTAEFRNRADALFGGAAIADGPDDTAAFEQLQREQAGFFDAQAAICGDLLPGDARRATAYSRFSESYRAFNEQQFGREMTSDFWPMLEQLAWSKLRARHDAVAEAMAIAADVRQWLQTGADRAGRIERLAAFRAEFETLRNARDTGSQIEQLNRLSATFGELPARLVEPQRQAWNAARVQLARSGELDRWLRTQTRPLVRFAKLDDKEVDLFAYWPATADRAGPRTQQGVPVALALANVPEDVTCLVQESSDGGRHWRSLRYFRGRWETYLPWQPREYRFRAVLPEGAETIDLPAFPHYLGPPS